MNTTRLTPTGYGTRPARAYSPKTNLVACACGRVKECRSEQCRVCYAKARRKPRPMCGCGAEMSEHAKHCRRCFEHRQRLARKRYACECGKEMGPNSIRCSACHIDLRMMVENKRHNTWSTEGTRQNCPKNVIEHAELCCKAVGVNLAEVFARDGDDYGYASRGKWSVLRARIWWLMRKVPMMGGLIASYPDIAAATMTRAHSAVIEAVQRHDALVEAKVQDAIDRAKVKLEYGRGAT